MGFGTSPYLQTTTHDILAVADFYPFAPAPCSCLGCCIPNALRARTFVHLYDNRITSNTPMAPFGMCTTEEKCMVDVTWMRFYDRQPMRTGMFCCVIPMTCCGPPVIYVKKPYCCCCIDVSDCFGTSIMASPSSWCNVKKYLCCGGPCYSCCAKPLFSGIKDGEQFLRTWDKALRAYAARTGIDNDEMAVFAKIKEDEMDLHSARDVRYADYPQWPPQATATATATAPAVQLQMR